MGRERKTKPHRVAEAGVALTRWPHIVGQQAVRTGLAEAVRANRAAHAYLFTGPRGVGKTALAFELALRLLCDGDGDEPCGTCSNCKLVPPLRHPDLHIVFPLPARKSGGDDDEKEFATLISEHVAMLAADPYAPAIPSKAKEIRIVAIRTALRRMSLKPFQSRRKVCLILHADTMNEAAQNALLKLLEEPPPDSYFLLTGENERMLRPTIRSRCRRLSIPPLSRAEIAAALCALKAPAAAAETAATVAEGSFSRARELLSNDLLKMQGLVIDFLRAAAMRNPRDLAGLSPQLLNSNALPAGTALELLALFLRDAALARAAAHSGAPAAFDGFKSKIAGVLEAFPRADFDAAVRAVDEAAVNLTRAYTADFVMFDLALRLHEALGPRPAAKNPKREPIHG